MTDRRIARDGIAIGVASGAYGVSFGAISVTSGLDLWQTCVLSLSTDSRRSVTST